MKILFFLFISLFLTCGCVFAQEPNITELRAITQAGGSLIVDLDKRKYTASELKMLAESLKYEATLTIKMSAKNRLSVSQCVQIAQSNPGKVVFWF